MKFRNYLIIISLLGFWSPIIAQSTWRLDSILYYSSDKDSRDVLLRMKNIFTYPSQTNNSYVRSDFSVVDKVDKLKDTSIFTYNNENQLIQSKRRNFIDRYTYYGNKNLESITSIELINGIEKVTNQYTYSINGDTIKYYVYGPNTEKVLNNYTIHKKSASTSWTKKIDVDGLGQPSYISHHQTYFLGDTVEFEIDSSFIPSLKVDTLYVLVKSGKNFIKTYFRNINGMHIPINRTIISKDDRGLIYQKKHYNPISTNDTTMVLQLEENNIYNESKNLFSSNKYFYNKVGQLKSRSVIENIYYTNDSLKIQTLTTYPDSSNVYSGILKIEFFANGRTLIEPQKIPLAQFMVYPNPSHSLIYFPTEKYCQPYKIINITGQIVESGIIDHGINIEHLVAGEYVIIVDRTYVKFIKI